MTARRPFESCFERRGDEECWPWIGRVDRYGYGKYREEGRERIAHRVAYELHHGAIPDGFEVDHTCLNALCVNPAHLEAVTGDENRRRQWSQDARARQRQRALGQHVHGGEGFGSPEAA